LHAYNAKSCGYRCVRVSLQCVTGKYKALFSSDAVVKRLREKCKVEKPIEAGSRFKSVNEDMI